MKSIFNILIVLLIAVSTTSGFAQIKNPRTETVKILGNCDTCKTAIENAGNLKNVASVIWNKDSKVAEITFDSKKTTCGMLQIRKTEQTAYNSYGPH